MRLNRLVVFLLVNCMMLFKLPNLFSPTVIDYPVPAAEKPVINPLKGWAPWVDDEETVYPVSMIFVRMHWSEIEPVEGEYRFEELEKELHMDFWRERGVRFLIRIVCDTPDEESHMDIPQWLYEKTYGDGDWYDCPYGKGYSPNYSNPVLIEEHRELIAAFAQYYKEDPQLGFVQLGSLGHWGEWHVNSSCGIRQFPKAEVYDQYVQAYLDVFPASKLLLRRPITLAAEAGIGLYNDSFGVTESHEKWLSWIRDGYVSSQSREEIGGMPEFWKYAASGGELATTYETEYYFSEGYEETLRLIKESHTTFIGPRGGAKLEEESLSEAVLSMSSELGYCFRLSEAQLRKSVWSPHYGLDITIENIGTAPFYENWPLLLQIRDAGNQVVFEQEQDILLTSLLPGEHHIQLVLHNLNLSAGEYSIYIGIVDPMTNAPGIAFANETEEDTRMYRIMEWKIEE